MKRVLLVFMFFVLTINAKAQWIGIKEVIDKSSKEAADLLRDFSSGYVQNTEYLQYWAGRLYQMEFDSEYNPTGYYKVLITHVTDRTDYKCGDIVIMNEYDIAKVDGWGLMTRRCK